MAAIAFRGNRRQLEDILHQLPAALAGGPDPFGVAQSVQLAAGVSLLSQIEQDFIVKSRGGTGRDGIRWKLLLRSTIAQRRIGKGDLADIGIKGAGQPRSRVRGLLTRDQDRQWRAIFAANLAKLRMVMSAGDAAAKAAQIAWGILKSKGAKTKLDVLGSRVVDIGRDTGRLLRSFAAGQFGSAPSEDQIFDTPPGRVIVGTNVPYAPKFAEARPFWPSGGRIPDAWAVPVREAIQGAIVTAVVAIAQRGAA